MQFSPCLLASLLFLSAGATTSDSADALTQGHNTPRGPSPAARLHAAVHHAAQSGSQAPMNAAAEQDNMEWFAEISQSPQAAASAMTYIMVTDQRIKAAEARVASSEARARRAEQRAEAATGRATRMKQQYQQKKTERRVQVQQLKSTVEDLKQRKQRKSAALTRVQEELAEAKQLAASRSSELGEVTEELERVKHELAVKEWREEQEQSLEAKREREGQVRVLFYSGKRLLERFSEYTLSVARRKVGREELDKAIAAGDETDAVDKLNEVEAAHVRAKQAWKSTAAHVGRTYRSLNGDEEFEANKAFCEYLKARREPHLTKELIDLYMLGDRA